MNNENIEMMNSRIKKFDKVRIFFWLSVCDLFKFSPKFQEWITVNKVQPILQKIVFDMVEGIEEIENISIEELTIEDM
jgi:hypothetical protein